MIPAGTVQQVRFSELCQFEPKQKAATLAADQHLFTLYGGSRGPGKSYWLRWYLLRELLKLGARGILNVRVGLFCEDYPSLKDRQINKIKSEFPPWLGVLKNSQVHGLGFHLRSMYGGGVLALRNLDDPSKYQSSEFAAVAVDELTKNPVNTFNILRGSLRWPGVERPKFLAGTNPGSIGHLWVRSYWIDDIFPPEMERLRHEFAFIKALPDDNPHLDASYWEMLDTLPPALAKAWRWGDWDVFAGQVFSQWVGERHTCRPFELPKHWPKWRAVDWGYRNPWCSLWLTQDPDIGRVYVYRELYETGLTDRQQARMITTNTPPSEKINITYADPSMWAKKNFEDRTFSSADEYRAEGVLLTPGDNQRLTGKRKIDTLLADLPDGKPGLMIFDTCANLIHTLPALPYDAANVEDVDSEAEDHAYDALRYGLTRVNPRPKADRRGGAPADRNKALARAQGLGRTLDSRDL